MVGVAWSSMEIAEPFVLLDSVFVLVLTPDSIEVVVKLNVLWPLLTATPSRKPRPHMWGL